MLGKLLKYDLKWTYKLLIIFYLLAIFFAVTGRILNDIENSFILNMIGKICVGTTIAMIVNIIINILMRSWVRFTRNLYKDESYLTHTLPVSKRTIYLSKILAGIISIFTSCVTIVICLLICYYTKENMESLKNSLQVVANTYDSTIFGLLLTLTGTVFLEVVFILFAGYLGIIVGHKSNNIKIIKSVIFGYVFYVATNVITLIGIFVWGLFNGDIMNLFNTVSAPSIDVIKSILYGGMVLYIIYIVCYYFIGRKQFEKGVNVD